MQNPFQNDVILKKLQNDVALLIFRFDFIYFFILILILSLTNQVPEEENTKPRRGKPDYRAAFEIGN